MPVSVDDISGCLLLCWHALSLSLSLSLSLFAFVCSCLALCSYIRTDREKSEVVRYNAPATASTFFVLVLCIVFF